MKIKVLSFRKNYEEEGKESAHYTAIVHLKDLPEELEDWRKVNLRDPNTKGDIYNSIVDTIKNASETFLRKNRGITILAEKVELNKDNDEIDLSLTDDRLHGVVDGGHTFTAIKDSRDATTNGYVALHLMTGIKDIREVGAIVDARNRSRSAQGQSLDNLQGIYDPIKKALAKLSYGEKISYSEYEVDDEKKRKPISVRDILSYIYCLNPEDHFKDDHPLAAYSGKGLVVTYFSPPYGSAKVGGKGYEEKVIEKAAPLLPSILTFVDYLYREIPLAYNREGEDGEKGSFGKLTTLGVQMKDTSLQFSGGIAKHRYPDAFLYPVLAAFRRNIIVQDGKWSWKEDPKTVWQRCSDAVGTRMRQIVERETSVNKLGKTVLNWTFLGDAIH